MGRSDPEVLDHLGDLVYRMGKIDLAEIYWRLGADQLKQESLSNRGLIDAKNKALNKLRQIQEEEKVEVSPLFESIDLNN